MKKYISLFLAIILCSFSVPVLAEPEISIILDGKYLYFDVPPQIIDDRTMVPLRAIFEALGAEVRWDSENLTAVAYDGIHLVTATIGNSVMMVNGRNYVMDISPMIIDDRTLVPARFIAEALECTVDWDGANSIVTITSNLRSEIQYYDGTEIPDYTSITGIELDFSRLTDTRTMYTYKLDKSSYSKYYAHLMANGWNNTTSEEANGTLFNILEKNGNKMGLILDVIINKVGIMVY